MNYTGGSLQLKSADNTQYVIARYNEDVSWAYTLRNKVIYDKGDALPGSVVLPNIGREAHTYLYHIVTNYDRLSEYTCFLQGNPFDHSANLFKKLQAPRSSALTFLTSWSASGNRDGCDKQPGVPPGYPGKMYDKYFIGSRTEFTWAIGAQFIVPKALIQSRPKWFYEKLLNEDPTIYPWVYERLWIYIFGDEPIRPAA
jgi:hypothetical protein